MIYLDNHSTTRVDRRVVEAMIPTFDTAYGNAGSVTHAMGMDAHELVESATSSIAEAINAAPEEIVFTSGATEANNLAIRGVCTRRHTTGHIITSVAEHKAVVDPIKKLEQAGFSVTRLGIGQFDGDSPGKISLDELSQSITDDTLLVSIMLGNNEIGTLQDIAAIAEICHQRGTLLHTDATQAVGKIPVDVEELGVDLMSFSAHKMYGPKGIGALYVRQSGRRVRLASQIDGGGQQAGLRSGTLNVTGIVGLSKAIEVCVGELCGETVSAAERNEKDQLEAERLLQLRDLLYARLCDGLGQLPVNGPALGDVSGRLHFNLNCQFPGLNAHSLMMIADDVAVSTGSACTSAEPEPSHVLTALGLTEDQIHCSLRFGIGRFNTRSEIIEAADALVAAGIKLKEFDDSSV